jgi:membrane-bound lytic murein transglycosylase MltF
MPRAPWKRLAATIPVWVSATVMIVAQAPTEKGRLGLALTEITRPWTGDLDGMIERRMIRVLTTYSKTQYFVDRGTPRGTAYDQGRLLEDVLNQGRGNGRTNVSVQFVPVSRNELLPALLEGKGDIVMADLTITPERSKLVDFTEPWIAGVDEIVVTSPKGPTFATVDDLSGKDVFVRESSSYYDSLSKLNWRFTAEGKPPVTLTPAPEELEDEDLLEMANAGLVDVVVVDNHKGWFWQRVWPSLKLYPAVKLRAGGEIAWAIRKNSPGLREALDRFLATNGRDSLNARLIFRRYLLNTQYVKGAAADASRRRFLSLVALFRKYGAQYDVDWMLMAAQGYQESRLDHNAKSHVGAIGVMQVMPATGQELRVGDIHKLEPNIHAGVKYMRGLVDRYFANEPMDDLNKMLFAFAAYNAGPGRVRQLRREASERGLDPNIWFNNVERISSERIGRETITYVNNIYKYYVTYLLIQGEYLERRELKKKTSTGQPD